MKISTFLKDPEYQQLLNIFPDLEYHDELYGKITLHTKFKKFFELANDYEFENLAGISYLVFFYKFGNKKVYFNYYDPEKYNIGLSRFKDNKLYIQNITDLNIVKSKLLKKKYNIDLIEKALNESKSLEFEVSSLEKLMGDRPFYYYEGSQKITFYDGEFEFSIEELNQLCKILEVDVNKMRVCYKRQDEGNLELELCWGDKI